MPLTFLRTSTYKINKDKMRLIGGH